VNENAVSVYEDGVFAYLATSLLTLMKIIDCMFIL